MTSASILETIEQLILSGQSSSHETLYPRDLNVQVVPKKVSVCIGVRRCGKSSYMRLRADELIAQGVSPENIVHINLADERLLPATGERLTQIWQTYYSLYPEKHLHETVYFFLDEIQLYDNWALFIDRLRRDENCEIMLSGSSAKLLSREIAGEMRGRSLSWELFPFSFGEYARSHGFKGKKHLSTQERFHLQNLWTSYQECGGFPETFNLPEETRVLVHQEYFNSLLFRDVVERHKVTNIESLRILALRLIRQISSLFSPTKLKNEFHSQGISLSRENIAQFLTWFEDAYFLFSVSAFHASERTQSTSPKKIYAIDHAFAQSLGSPLRSQRGQLLENIVFLALRRCTPSVYYYTTSNRLEVDFLAIRSRKAPLLVQVCENLDDPKTRTRELRALRKAIEERQLTQAYIVTQSERDTLSLEEGTIDILPAPQFLLMLERDEI